MPVETRTAATLEDLARVGGKAELIAGRIVRFMPTGFRPGQIGGRIYRSLDDHAARTGRGVALPDNVGFAVPTLSSGRQSFAPDASFFLGPLPADDMDFIPGPPTLAVEVRSKGDQGEPEMAARRADYFEAGTEVVWDVDPRTRLIHSFRADAPDDPETFGPGQVAHAEAAVPGWRLAADALFA
jgi:Uma2 family endonuclease